MNREDIRWIQRFNHFRKAFAQLKEAVELSEQRKLSKLEEQGLIQAFEYTHEMAWNVLKDFLEGRGAKKMYGLDEVVERADADHPLAGGDDPVLAPLRVVWLGPESAGTRAPGLIQLILFGDPRDPGAIRQRWIRRRHPERCRIVAGEPARLSELRERWRKLAGSDGSETVGLPDFVCRQAALALERAERRLRGLRYKVPRFVHESILERAAFQGGIRRLAWDDGSDVEDVRREATADLHEIAASHSPYMIDLTPRSRTTRARRTAARSGSRRSD